MKILLYNYLFVVFLLVQACNQTQTEANNKPQVLPTVSTIQPIIGIIQKKEQVNGQVVYFNKTTITAPVTGYITDVKTALGNKVKKGDLLFKIQTKESKALQNSNISAPKQFGVIPVYASSSGFINSLTITEPGVFITEGNSMATVIKNTDLLIQVNAPFEYSQLLKSKTNVAIELPNKNVVTVNFYKALQTVDPVSQTQQLLFKLKEFTPLPENLNVVVTIISKHKNNSTILPKDVVLTNETQDEFWIMKVNQDSLALKVPVKIGIANNEEVEILSPALSTSDRFIVKGAYGLPDSSKVKFK